MTGKGPTAESIGAARRALDAAEVQQFNRTLVMPDGEVIEGPKVHFEACQYQSYAGQRAARIARAAAGERYFTKPPIGRVFMTPTILHLPGWPRPIRLFGFVPRLLGGVPGQIPSADSLDAHFRRRELKQNRDKF